MRSRREFLAGALMAGAGAAIFEPLGALVQPDTAGAAPGPDYDPGFLAGTVIDIASDGTLTVIDADSQVRQLVLVPGSSVWKQGQINGPTITVGDCLYARGTPDSSGRLAVASAWVAIDNFDAAVVQPGSSSLQVQLASGTIVTVKTFDLTEVWSGPSGSPVLGDASAFSAGTPVQVIGFTDTSSLVTTATQLFALDSLSATTPSPTESQPPVITPGPNNLCGYTYYRLATWQCCGGVNGCGSGRFPACNPPPGGHGACGTCRTDRQGIAWPCVNGHGGCAIQNCNPNLPFLSCGTYVNIANHCGSLGASIQINDRGPATRCISPHGCYGFRTVALDLTACTFTAIGGNLSAGFLDARVTVYLPC